MASSWYYYNINCIYYILYILINLIELIQLKKTFFDDIVIIYPSVIYQAN